MEVSNMAMITSNLALHVSTAMQAPGYSLRTCPFHFPLQNHRNSRLPPAISLIPACNATNNRPRTCPPITRAVQRSEGQGNHDGVQPSKEFNAVSLLDIPRGLLDFCVSNFLPLALISAVALGMINPTLGCYAHRYSLSKFCTSGIFFISGLKLQEKEIEEVLEAWPTMAFGLGSILLVSPFLSRLILQVGLAPQEFVTGLALFCCMPTTLSSGIALTQLARGNSALALALTVISNLLGIVTVPFWILKLLADGLGVSIPVGKLFCSLILTLLVPLVLGKVMRNSFAGLARYVDQNDKILSMISTVLLSITPWMQVSKARPLVLLVQPLAFIGAIGMATLVHLILLSFNAIGLQILSSGFGGKESIFKKKEISRTLLIVCSQKALLIVVAVVEQLSGALGQSGLLVLPCVSAHITQIIIDSVLVNFWLQKDEPRNKIKTF